jgi:hypothetical protein
MSSIRLTLARLVLGGLIVAIAPSASLADGFGHMHFPHHGFGWKSSSVGMTNFGTSSVLMPMGLVNPTMVTSPGLTTNALLPMGLAPSGLSSNALMPSGVVFYVAGASNSGTAPQLLGTESGKTQSPLLPNAVGPAGGDIRTEYNNFVFGENASYPAGLTLHPSDVAQMGANHSALANAVGGVHRLGSIGRFLRTKLNDPNFRAKAFDLFGMFLGVALPQFQPAIDLFLGQLGQGTNPRLTPSPNDTPNPIDLGSVGGRFEGQLTANGGFSGRFTPDPTQGATPPPPRPGTSDPLNSMEAVARALGATVVSRDSSGITLKTADGREVKFGPDGRPIP